jgi:hypothetical protein
VKQIFYYALSLCIFLYACNNNTPHSKQQEKKPVYKPVSFRADTARWYKRYNSTIDNEAVVVTLLHYRDDRPEEGMSSVAYSGMVYYSNKREEVSIHSGASRHDSVVLTEDNNRVWIAKISGHTIEGIRINADGTGGAPIHLEESYPEGTYALDVVNRDDTMVVEWEDNNYSQFDVSIMVLGPSPEMDSAEAAFLDRTLVHILRADTLGATTMKDVPAAMNRMYVAAYVKHIGDVQEDGGEFSVTYNNDIKLQTECVYNKRGILGFEFNACAYMGGNHGIFQTSTAHVDMIARKELHLADIINTDDPSIGDLLDEAGHAYMKSIGDDESANGIYVEHIPPTENFIISDKGLTFCYSPYEIAGFVYGRIDLFLPYSKLTRLLNPAFSKRMNL